jgi:hypothetical protein
VLFVARKSWFERISELLRVSLYQGERNVASEHTTEHLQIERLKELMNYCQKAARLRQRTVSDVAAHDGFRRYEHELEGIPGLVLNAAQDNEETENWLSLKRVTETRPPVPSSRLLQLWMLPSNDPDKLPVLKGEVLANELAEMLGEGLAYEDVGQEDALVALEVYPEGEVLKSEFSQYLDQAWRPWAAKEKTVRESVKLYGQLFELRQDIRKGSGSSQIELVWGIGVGLWDREGQRYRYPLITQAVELVLDEKTSILSIRPREVPPRIETDWFDANGIDGVKDLKEFWQRYIDQTEESITPFSRTSFDLVLRHANSCMDSGGVYWPDRRDPEDIMLPAPDDHLCVTDSWVIFARPKGASEYLRDLDALFGKVSSATDLPEAVAKLVTEPSKEIDDQFLPRMRGLLATYHDITSGNGDGVFETDRVRELYFPKPFNNEQVKIVQYLEKYPCVVVEGPPGTGKTHTIANVICHYLAMGKRVLVTSMKEPALSVVQEKIPEGIRSLVVPLLSGDEDAQKRFQNAITQIASQVQGIDRSATRSEIERLDVQIEQLHGRLAHVDFQLRELATRALTPLMVDGVYIDPSDAAQELVNATEGHAFIPDEFDGSETFRPSFDEADVEALRAARFALGPDVVYAGAPLPDSAHLPTASEVRKLHEDLKKGNSLREKIEKGDIPPAAEGVTLERLEAIGRDLKVLSAETSFLEEHGELVAHVARDEFKRIQGDFEVFGVEVIAQADRYNQLRKSAISLPKGLESGQDEEVIQAIRQLADGRKPFGMAGVFGKREQKAMLAEIRIAERPVSTPDQWKEVLEWIELLRDLRVQVTRWEEFASLLGMPQAAKDRRGWESVLHSYLRYQRVQRALDLVRNIQPEVKEVFPTLAVSGSMARGSIQGVVTPVLEQHLQFIKLQQTERQRDELAAKFGEGSVEILEKARQLVLGRLGDSALQGDGLEQWWNAMCSTLERLRGLARHLEVVSRVTQLIAESGAPRYASLLKRHVMEGQADPLSGDLLRAWRLKRLDSMLESTLCHRQLKDLAAQRKEITQRLAQSYEEAVIRRAWLGLAEKATPAVKSALKAFQIAIQKIGKGTGIRAERYRQNARAAAAEVTDAIPCWIMPHYRVSESLPAELGCFDLVIIDEASQSDLSALPALLRGKKALVVGDDKQVAPEVVGYEEKQIRQLVNTDLVQQVPTYRQAMSPERSLYDLYMVVNAGTSIMLKEHFRCVGPIIEYSKREFYNHELIPLRVPVQSERLDPPLIDILVTDGHRSGTKDVNVPEARVIVDEIKRIIADGKASQHAKKRTIGVVTLLGTAQAKYINELVLREIDPKDISARQIACGDARTFQGEERDIILLSMVAGPDKDARAATGAETKKRFNVAASRARDRMYLVRSVTEADLSVKDELRLGLIRHFTSPYAQDVQRQRDLRQLCESGFEREVYDALVERGYVVTPQVRFGSQFRIDMVVEGEGDRRLAVECDGDSYHGPEHWLADITRQRILERAGWTFWRCFASQWTRYRQDMLEDLLSRLDELDIRPMGGEATSPSIYTEHRRVCSAVGDGGSATATSSAAGMVVDVGSMGRRDSMPLEVA